MLRNHEGGQYWLKRKQRAAPPPPFLFCMPPHFVTFIEDIFEACHFLAAVLEAAAGLGAHAAQRLLLHLKQGGEGEGILNVFSGGNAI